jgi:hypothetical protein
MRRTKTFLGVVAVMAAMLVAFAAPAMANDHNDWDWNDRHDNDRWWDNRFDRFEFDDGDFDNDFDQEADTGDIDQDFDVSNTGDNSNQTAGIQGVANTGNAQNQIGVFDAGNGFDDDFFDDHNRFFFDDDDGDFEFDDVGSSIEVSPTNVTSSDQEVNQAASAFGK